MMGSVGTPCVAEQIMEVPVPHVEIRRADRECGSAARQ